MGALGGTQFEGESKLTGLFAFWVSWRTAFQQVVPKKELGSHGPRSYRMLAAVWALSVDRAEAKARVWAGSWCRWWGAGHGSIRI